MQVKQKNQNKLQIYNAAKFQLRYQNQIISYQKITKTGLWL